MSAVPGGFEVRFTTPIPVDLSDAAVRPAVKIKSWVYRDAPEYGSPELDEHDEQITQVKVGGDHTSVRISLAKTEQPAIHPDQTARVYQISVAGQDLWGVSGPGFEAFYTLYEFPAASPQ
ncbi:MAG: hypothetical protein ABIZ04_00250 [Opitutus sp.]